MTLKASKALTDKRLIGALDTFRIYSDDKKELAADDPITGLIVEFLGCRIEWNPFSSSFEKSSDGPWQSVAINNGQARYFRFSSAAKPELLIQGIVDIDIRGDLVYNNTDLRTGMPQFIDYFSIKVAK